MHVMFEEWSGESTTWRGPVEQEANSGRAGGTVWQPRRISAVLSTRLGRVPVMCGLERWCTVVFP